MPLIQLFKDFYVDPESVVVVRPTAKSQCALFTSGQSAVDEGFLLPYAAKKVVQALNEAMEFYGEGDEEDDEEEIVK